MRQELQKKLFDKYPKIFRQKDLSMRETCMCWGIDTGDGWYDLIDNLCSVIQFWVKYNEEPQVEASQVKEKFGGLRFYTSGHSDFVNGLITLTEHLSKNTCSVCGSVKNITKTKGWIRTVCKSCLTKETHRNHKELNNGSANEEAESV